MSKIDKTKFSKRKVKFEASKKLFKIKNKELEDIALIAQEASRLKSEFLANVSHELRTPINAILGFATLMYDDMVDPNSPQYKEFLHDIIESANHLLLLINDVLDLAKIEADKMEFHPEKIDLLKLLNETQAIFYPAIIKKNIQLKIDIDENIGNILLDPTRLKQVIYNYLSNAIKFTSDGGKVFIRVFSNQANTFCLEVEDTGIGIAKDDLKKLFVKFQQIDASAKKSFSGTGLGLALTKRIVEAQGGMVGVESTPGKGSTFYAIFPRFPYHPSSIEEEEKDAQLLQAERKPTLLVIEEASQQRTLMTEALTDAGYSIVTTATVGKAVEQKYMRQFDAIILDLYHPDLKGWEIIRNLRAKTTLQEEPPIVISAVLGQPISVGFKIHDFLIKPVKPQELLAALEWVGAPAQQDKTVLIIDNDQEALELSETLGKFGFRVVCRSNKVSALLALENEAPDVVLLDPFLTGMDGFEFLRRYRHTEKGLFTPVIILTTAKLSAEDRIQLNSTIQRVVVKSGSTTNNILAGLEQRLLPK